MAKVKIGDKIVKIGNDDYVPSVEDIDMASKKLGIGDKPRVTGNMVQDSVVAGPGIARGLQAVRQGLKIEDAPFLAAKTVSGAMAGMPEFFANRPVAALTEAGTEIADKIKSVSRPSNDLFPKPVTESGRKLGEELELAASAAPFAGTAPKVGEKITRAAAQQIAKSDSALAKASYKVIEFAQEVRGDYFKQRTMAGKAFEESIENLSKANPDRKVNLRPAIESLGIEVEEGGQLTSKSPKLLADIKSALSKSKNKVLDTVLRDPVAAENLTLEQAQQVKNSINKIPSFAAKQKQGKFAQFTDTDGSLIEFIGDIRDAQLSAFPEFADTLDNYRQVMSRFTALKPKFKEGRLINNLFKGFGDPEIEKMAGELLSKDVYGKIKAVRGVKTAQKIAKFVGGGAAAYVGGNFILKKIESALSD